MTYFLQRVNKTTRQSAKPSAATTEVLIALAKPHIGQWMEPAVQMGLGVSGGNVYLIIGLQELLVSINK